MASSQKTVDYITDQIAQAGDIRSRKMFGEYAIYCNEKVVALVCDDTLFVKITAAGEKLLPSVKKAPPYPGAKPYFQIAEEHWDNREWLISLVTATAASLPVAKRKK